MVRLRLVGLALLTGLALTLAFGVGSTQGQQHAAGPALADAHPCAEAPGFTCSTLVVPLDRSGKAPGRLRLQVATQDGAAPRGELLFLTGGPGQPGVPSATRVAVRLGPAVAGYRLVLFDQRGTGAGALQCPALQRQMGSTDLAVPTKSAVRACANALGARRRFFGTAETVQDLEALRRALGVARISIDGVSYGTFVAERYALRYPAHVARLVLDSVVPHAGADPLSIAGAHATARVLRSVCRDSRCASDPARDLAEVFKRSRLGPRFLNALVTMSVVDPTFSGVVQALDAARKGSRGPLDALLRRWGPDSMTPAEALSQGLHASALCADTPMPWGDASTPLARRAPALRRAVARIPAAALWPFDRSAAAGNGIVRTCLYWPPMTAPPKPVAGDLPPVPTLLLAGDRDLSTPVAWARAEAARAPRGRLVVVPGAGHSVQMRANIEAGREAVRAFLG
jgi:pimeloyl-ACP methyl ester carboxylesterase